MKFSRPFLSGVIFPLWMIFVGASIQACSSDSSPSRAEPESQYALGTICTVNLFEEGTIELYAKAFGRIHELEEILSANKDGTDLDRVNKNAGLEAIKVRPELIEVLEIAYYFAEKSGGSFDPSIGPLVKLWGIGSGEERIPGEEEIREAQKQIDYRKIEINQKEKTVFLRRAGMALDLGAIAKGYAADEVVKLLRREGVERAIIDLGGDIFAMGEKNINKSSIEVFTRLLPGREKKTDNDETYWRIGIQDPRDERGSYIGILRVKNKSVVTSGIYERFFEENGKRYHHIFSAESGYPVENGLLSVTIVAESSIDADALSTTVFVLGWEGGRDLIADINGAEGIFVFDDLTVRLTENLEDDFFLTAAEYRLAE